MSATGMPDGDYQIGSLKVIVKDSTARLENGLSLAGSTLTMQKAVSNALELGISNQIVENAAKLLPSALLRGVS
jgi:N-acetylglucosamine-6-phosphate deacetylase